MGNTERPTRRRPTGLFAALLATSFLFVGAQAGTTIAASAPLWPYTATVSSSSVSGLAAGKTYDLIHLVNLTMEDVANVVGQATLQVNVSPSPYACLNGASVNVFGLDGQFYLHDGDQGPQCAYGTWEIAPQSLGWPGQAPLVTSARLSVSPVTPSVPRLLAQGRNFGAAPGSVILIGYSTGSTGPVVSTKVTSWAPGSVAATAQGALAEGQLYYVLLLTASGAAASAVVKVPPTVTARPRVFGAPPGTTVVLTVGSPLAKIGKRTVRLGAAPALRNGQLLAPLGLLSWLAGARTRSDPSAHQLRMATARAEVIFQLGSPRYALDGHMEAGGAAPTFAGRVLLVPVAPVARAFGLSTHQGPGHTVVLGRVAPFESTHPGRGSGSGNGGSGGSGGGQPVTKTITTAYGLKGQPLVAGLTTSTWCNVPHAPSYLGGFALGSCTAGPQSANNPGSGIADIGASVFGVAGGEADQPIEVAYTSQAPSGVTSTVSVKAIVDSADMTFGLSGAGGSCAPTEVNSSPMQPGTDTLSTCLSTFQAVIPLGDVASVTSSVLSYGNQLWSGLSGAQQGCIDTPQQGTSGANCALAAANALMSVQNTGLSVTLHQSVFTWNGTTTGGATSYFTVDPEVQVSDVGLGTEINFMTSYVLFVVTEQYTENQYAWSFPVAEVGQPLISPWLEQCASSNPLSCQLVAGSNATVTSGNLPNGMSVQSQGGDIVLAGAPASGSEGVYQFSLQVAGGNTFDCAIDVAPPLSLQQQGSASTFYYETGVGFANEKAFALPFGTTGGVDGVTWDLAGNPPWLGVAYSPPTSTSTGSPPVLYTFGQVPSSGSYPFKLQAWDYYTAVTSGQLWVDVVPKLSLASHAAQEAARGQSYHWDLSPWRSGGASPYSWEVDGCQHCGALPPGLSLDRTSGVLSGYPSTDGTYHFIVAVTDGIGATATTEMSLTVYSQQPLTVQPSSLPSGTVGSSYSAQLQASGAGTPPFQWSVTAGSLPPGLSLSVAASKPWYGSEASISGTPTKAGAFSFTLRLSDAKEQVATRSFHLEVEQKGSTTTTCPPKNCSPPPPKL